MEEPIAERFPQNNALLKKALDFVDRACKYPKRIRWVKYDRAKVEDLLSRLVSSNNFLQEVLNTHQLGMLRLQEGPHRLPDHAAEQQA